MIPKKIGRNEICWCGSGVKYKKCHLDREKQKPVGFWEASKKFTQKFSVEVCSCPSKFHSECSDKIIKAHTIPKSSSLKAIAKDGHVYGFNFSLSNINKNYGHLKPELIGINRASTFTGFCKTHDDKIFAPLEKNIFESSLEQCFLLTYRAFSRECYTKTAMANLHELRSSLDKGKSIKKQMDIQMKNFLINLGATAGLKDNQFHKSKFDEALVKEDFSSCQAIVFEFNLPPPVMVSGAVNPDFDFNGNHIQDLSDFESVPNLLAMSSFYDGKKGYIVMSWQTHSSEAPIKLVQSLLNKTKSEYEKYLVQYMFKNFENCFMEPYWWDTTSESNKKILIDLMSDTISLESDINGDGISTLKVSVDFPSIQAIKFINWKPNVIEQN